MSARKMSQDAKPAAPSVVPTVDRPRKKTRAPRVRLTHFEVRRGDSLRLRIAIADDAIAHVGDELGALIKQIAPSARVSIVQPTHVRVPAPDIVVSQEHVEHDDAYHAALRDHLSDIFSTLCDTALDDAIALARKERDERDRRAEGTN